MKKALLALLVVALILAVAVPVMAKKPDTPPGQDKPPKPDKAPWDWTPYTSFGGGDNTYMGYDLPDSTNDGCSAAFWTNNPELIPCAAFPEDPTKCCKEVVGDTCVEWNLDQKGIDLEAETGYLNYEAFSDRLNPSEINDIVADYNGPGKPDKGLAELLKLWNKGYWGIVDWVDDDNDPSTPDVPVYGTVKTCPY
jgi:hypothetical protein